LPEVETPFLLLRFELLAEVSLDLYKAGRKKFAGYRDMFAAASLCW
jgi:hypothetical protein